MPHYRLKRPLTEIEIENFENTYDIELQANWEFKTSLKVKQHLLKNDIPYYAGYKYNNLFRINDVRFYDKNIPPIPLELFEEIKMPNFSKPFSYIVALILIAISIIFVEKDIIKFTYSTLSLLSIPIVRLIIRDFIIPVDYSCSEDKYLSCF